MLASLRPALVLFGVLTLLTGVVYPLTVTAGAQVLFPASANGSLLIRDGRVVGSTHIGQEFDDPRYFWGRPSATGPQSCNGSASSGSNLGPSNPVLLQAVAKRISSLRRNTPDANLERQTGCLSLENKQLEHRACSSLDQKRQSWRVLPGLGGRKQAFSASGKLIGALGTIPVDLVTASGSGLDPDISPAAALYQVARVAQLRGLPEARVRTLVEASIEGRTVGLLGERRVNVLRLNLALDALARPGT